MENESIKLELIEHGQSKKCAEVYFRNDWECYYFSLLGKCFGLMSNDIITLKGEPHVNEALREKYSDIEPGYYTNKMHWNSIRLNTKQLSLYEIKKLIDTSYELIKSKLTKVQKEQIDNKD